MNRCRICLSEDLLTNIFSKCGLVMISTKVISVAKIQISPDDGLPSKICTKCVEQLDSCIEFINQCQNTDSELRLTLLKHKNETMKTDINLENDFSLNIEEYSPKSDELLIDESGNECNPTDLNFSNKIIEEINEEVVGINVYGKHDKKKSQKQQCFTCGKVMSSRFRLKTHLRTHTGERPYSCIHCNKNFSLAQNLKVHLRTHTGEKPLQCSVCGESFAQSAGLAAHRRKHTGQLPYSCILCPRSFRTVGHLQYHTRRHTGEKNFECDTCGRAFITRSDLKQHLRTHSGERLHVCSVCGLRLTRASHLKRHTLHAHNKQHSCNTCGEQFLQKSELNKHLGTHEGNDGVEK